jgi:hypothetical protein
MGMTVLQGCATGIAFAAFDFPFPAVLRFAVSLAVVSKSTACFRARATPVKAGQVFWRVFASLLGQGVFGQMDVLQTIIDQGHPD